MTVEPNYEEYGGIDLHCTNQDGDLFYWTFNHRDRWIRTSECMHMEIDGHFCYTHDIAYDLKAFMGFLIPTYSFYIYLDYSISQAYYQGRCTTRFTTHTQNCTQCHPGKREYTLAHLSFRSPLSPF